MTERWAEYFWPHVTYDQIKKLTIAGLSEYLPPTWNDTSQTAELSISTGVDVILRVAHATAHDKVDQPEVDTDRVPEARCRRVWGV